VCCVEGYLFIFYDKLEKEFLAEVEILGNIQHSHIVKLLCCHASEDSKLPSL